MKVLTVCHSMPFYGGAELVIMEISKYMAHHGILNGVVSPSLCGPVKLEFNNLDIAGFPVIPCDIETEGKIMGYLDLQSVVFKIAKNHDVINVHNFPATLTLIGIKKPIVWMCNEPPEVFTSLARKPLEALNRWMVRRNFSKVVVADEYNAERVRKIYGIEPEIIHYGVDYDFWAEGERQLNANRFTVVHVGTVTPLKNQMASIQAIQSLRRRIPDIQLVLAGWTNDGDYLKELQGYIEAHDLEKYVVFLGALPRHKLRELYHIAHVMIHPVMAQGGWLSPFEALCAGVPIIVGNDATMSDVVRRHDLGVTADDMTEAILGVYSEYSEYQSSAESARQWVRENLSWEKFCQRFVGVMEEAIKERR